MAFNSLVANPGRLRILTALLAEPQQDFVRLRSQTQLTDGNLCTHARRLSTAGMVEIHKTIREGKPATHFRITTLGRQSVEDHAHALLAALNAPTNDRQTDSRPIDDMMSDRDVDWVD